MKILNKLRVITKFFPLISRISLSGISILIWFYYDLKSNPHEEALKLIAMSALASSFIPLATNSFLINIDFNTLKKILISSCLISLIFLVLSYYQGNLLIVSFILLFACDRVTIPLYTKVHKLNEFYTLTLITRLIGIIYLHYSITVSIHEVLLCELLTRAIHLKVIFIKKQDLMDSYSNFFSKVHFSSSVTYLMQQAISWLPIAFSSATNEKILLARILSTMLGLSSIFWNRSEAYKRVENGDRSIFIKDFEYILMIIFSLLFILLSPYIYVYVEMHWDFDIINRLLEVVSNGQIWLIIVVLTWLMSSIVNIMNLLYSPKKEFFVTTGSLLVLTILLYFFPHQPNISIVGASLVWYLLAFIFYIGISYEKRTNYRSWLGRKK